MTGYVWRDPLRVSAEKLAELRQRDEPPHRITGMHWRRLRYNRARAAGVSAVAAGNALGLSAATIGLYEMLWQKESA